VIFKSNSQQFGNSGINISGTKEFLSVITAATSVFVNIFLESEGKK